MSTFKNVYARNTKKPTRAKQIRVFSVNPTTFTPTKLFFSQCSPVSTTKHFIFKSKKIFKALFCS